MLEDPNLGSLNLLNNLKGVPPKPKLDQNWTKIGPLFDRHFKIGQRWQSAWGNRFLYYRGRLCIGATDSFTTEVDCVLRRGGDPHPKTHFLEKAGDHNFACPSDQLAKTCSNSYMFVTTGPYPLSSFSCLKTCISTTPWAGTSLCALYFAFFLFYTFRLHFLFQRSIVYWGNRFLYYRSDCALGRSTPCIEVCTWYLHIRHSGGSHEEPPPSWDLC